MQGFDDIVLLSHRQIVVAALPTATIQLS